MFLPRETVAPDYRTAAARASARESRLLRERVVEFGDDDDGGGGSFSVYLRVRANLSPA